MTFFAAKRHRPCSSRPSSLGSDPITEKGSGMPFGLPKPAHSSTSLRLPPPPNPPAACRGPARAAGYRRGHATFTALPLSALWRPHDRDRGVRTRLRAEVASDAQQGRHIMSQTALERRDFPVPMRWPDAGSDLSRPGQRGRRTVRPLIRSECLPRCLLHACDLASVQLARPPPVSVKPP